LFAVCKQCFKDFREALLLEPEECVLHRTSGFSFMPPQVPRLVDMTGHKSAEDKAVDREHERQRQLFKYETKKYGFGTQNAKHAWKRRTERTRSF